MESFSNGQAFSDRDYHSDSLSNYNLAYAQSGHSIQMEELRAVAVCGEDRMGGETQASRNALSKSSLGAGVTGVGCNVPMKLPLIGLEAQGRN